MDGEQVRAERHRRGWSQTHLSARTGIAASDLSAIERGRRALYPGWRRRIAKAFRMRVTDLFPDAGETRPGAPQA